MQIMALPYISIGNITLPLDPTLLDQGFDDVVDHLSMSNEMTFGDGDFTLVRPHRIITALETYDGPYPTIKEALENALRAVPAGVLIDLEH